MDNQRTSAEEVESKWRVRAFILFIILVLVLWMTSPNFDKYFQDRDTEESNWLTPTEEEKVANKILEPVEWPE